MTPRDRVTTSKFLSLVLRHEPQRVGIRLDAAGWVDVDELLEALARHGKPLSFDELREVVDTSDKQRFAISDDEMRIRANQGHSVAVELDHPAAEPPEFLYHGTSAPSVESIRREGLDKMNRHHVHLSADAEATLRVGARRGRPVLLTIRAGDMHRAGHRFFVTPNRVWLTDRVPPQFIGFPGGTPP